MPTPNAKEEDERERAVALLWSVLFDLEMIFFNRKSGKQI
jgi:hypothetical protein